jgi:hypothetical protein
MCYFFAHFSDSTLFLYYCRFVGCVSIDNYSFKKDGRERRYFPASLLFALHATVSLTALHGMNIPMYSALKVLNKSRNNSVLAMIISSIYYKTRCFLPHITINMNIITLQRCTPLVSLMLSILVLKKSAPSKVSISKVLLIGRRIDTWNNTKQWIDSNSLD